MLEEETQVATEVTPPIETTDNQAEVEKLKSDNLKLQQTVTRHANRENELKRQNTEYLAKFNTFEETQAQILDGLDEIRGDTTETPSKTSRVDALRKTRDAQPKAETPTEVAQFISFLNSEGLNMKDAIVMESVQGREPEDALVYLKTKIKSDMESKADKRAEEIAEKKVQKILKDMGVAKSEGSPSGANQSDDAFMQAYSKGETDDHVRAKKILEKMR